MLNDIFVDEIKLIFGRVVFHFFKFKTPINHKQPLSIVKFSYLWLRKIFSVFRLKF